MNLAGALGGGKGLSFLASVKILADGGRLEAYPERIYAEKANALTLIVAAATSYRGNDYRSAVERALSAAAAAPYDTLKSQHVADHQTLFRRVRLQLGDAGIRLRRCRPTSGSSVSREARPISGSKRCISISAAIC